MFLPEEERRVNITCMIDHGRKHGINNMLRNVRTEVLTKAMRGKEAKFQHVAGPDPQGPSLNRRL